MLRTPATLRVVAVLGVMPSARPSGLHHSPLQPRPFRLVSITACLPPIAPEMVAAYATSTSVTWKFETFRLKPWAASTLYVYC